MSEAFDWDRFGDDARIKFNAPGDTAVGDIIKLEIRTLPAQNGDGSNDFPEMTLKCDDGKIRTLLATQVGLKQQLSEQKPSVGDRVRVTFKDTTNLGGGKAAKNFSLEIKRGGGAPVAAPTAAAAAENDPF